MLRGRDAHLGLSNAEVLANVSVGSSSATDVPTVGMVQTRNVVPSVVQPRHSGAGEAALAFRKPEYATEIAIVPKARTRRDATVAEEVRL